MYKPQSGVAGLLVPFCVRVKRLCCLLCRGPASEGGLVVCAAVGRAAALYVHVSGCGAGLSAPAVFSELLVSDLLGLQLYLRALYSLLLRWRQSCHYLNVCCIPCTCNLAGALGDEGAFMNIEVALLEAADKALGSEVTVSCGHCAAFPTRVSGVQGRCLLFPEVFLPV